MDPHDLFTTELSFDVSRQDPEGTSR